MVLGEQVTDEWWILYNNTGYGFACFKHPVLAVVTKANWSTKKLELFINSAKYKNWQHPITPHAYNAYKKAQKALQDICIKPFTTVNIRNACRCNSIYNISK